MKKIAVVALMALCMTGMSTRVYADYTTDWEFDGTGFTSTLDFFGSEIVGDDVTYLQINDGNSSAFTFSYSHTLPLSNPPYTLSSANLSLIHSYTGQGSEAWFVYRNENDTLDTLNKIPIGVLTAPNSGNEWTTSELNLGQNILGIISSGDTIWELQVVLQEGSPGTDWFRLDQSILSGTVTSTTSAVPLPGAAILLGSGLIGIAGLKRNRKNS